MRFTRLWFVFLLALATAVSEANAHAADPVADSDREAALRAKGNALMASSNWADALPVWAELFGVAGKSLDLWNAAVCQYHLVGSGKATPDQALALLLQYRNLPDTTEEKKAKAQRYIDQMTALKEKSAEPARAPIETAAGTSERPTPQPLATPHAAETPESNSGTSWSIGKQRIWAIAAASVGVVALGIGIGYGLDAISKHKDANAVCPEKCADQAGVNLWNQATSAGNISTAAFIIGAVGIAGGAVLWFSADGHPGETQKKGTGTQIGLGLGSIRLSGIW